VARIAGPAAITPWTWIITLPFALTVMSGMQYVTGGLWAALAVAGVEHILIGVLLAAAAALLRAVRGALRPPAVLAVFVLIGAARPLLFLVAGGLLGVRVAAGDLGGRTFINIVVVVAVFALIALGVALVREHRSVFRRLRAARRAADADAARAAERLRLLRATAVDEVVAALEHASAVAASDPPDAAGAARVLRALAEEVVRPASHRVYDDAAPVGLAEAPRMRAGEWVASVAAGLGAPPALPTASLFSALTVPFGLLIAGPAGLAVVAGGFLVLWAAGSAAARIALPRRAAPRLVVLVAVHLLTGVLLAALGAGGLALLGADGSSAWFEVATYPAVALAVSFVLAVSARLRRDQADLEAAVQDSVGAAARLRADLDRERASLARLLHGGVQSELIAAALALTLPDDGTPPGERLGASIARARDALLGGRREPDAADAVRALIESWSSAMELEVRIHDGVGERLGEPRRASAVVDVISEGLANTVRHGDGSPVVLHLRPAGPFGAEVRIVSGGSPGSSREGIGLRQLAEHGTVSLTAVAGRVELTVVIP
jgi:signal transduction histidine kinase